MSKYRYGILGAGRQGVAAAYDLIIRGEAASVILGDLDAERARIAAQQVNRLTGEERATGVGVDAGEHDTLVKFLRPLDAFLSAVPYKLNLQVTRAALEAGTHMCDLGGNTDVVWKQLDLDAKARQQGICVVPDCGQVPGTGANLMAYVLTLLDEAEEVLLFDGGIPQHPRPPWNYELTFHIDGLTNEYYGTTIYLIDGQRVEVECFDPDEYELVNFDPPLGTLEAFTTAGGTSTTPWTLAERVKTLKNKTLRYPGHACQFKAFRDAGFFEESPIMVDGVEVVPRRVYHTLIEPKIRATEETRDVVISRVIGKGRKQGRLVEVTVDVLVYYDEELGFTAMQQATGWHAAIVCWLMASGQISPGVTPVETAVDPVKLVAQLRRRGFQINETVEHLEA
jgi:lysine 6-dehydrogenase